MRFYELLYIARSDLTTTQTEDLNAFISNVIKGANKENSNESNATGSIATIESWGVKNLPYKSKKLKRNKGSFCLIRFSLEDYSVLKELNTRLKLNESVLRFIIKQISTEDLVKKVEIKKVTAASTAVN